MSEPLLIFTNEEKDAIWRTKATGAPQADMDNFFHIAQRCGLDPRANQLYIVKRGDKWTIQTGIDGYRLIADRTGQYAGNDDAEIFGETENGYPAAAKVTVYKMVQGQRCPFSATARWDEYFPGDSQGRQWKKMPCVMLGKVAEALALRKAFPADLSGLYTSEEMEQAGEAPAPLAVSEAPQQPVSTYQETPRKPDDIGGQDYTPQGDVAGKSAFGYKPMRWPLPKMFAEPATEAQGKMAWAKARERMMDLDELDIVRRLVLEAYALEDDQSKASMSLFIDWLMNADDEMLDRASAAAEAQPRPELDLS